MTSSIFIVGACFIFLFTERISAFQLVYCSPIWQTIDIQPGDIFTFRTVDYPNSMLMPNGTLKQPCQQNFTSSAGRRIWIAFTNAFAEGFRMDGIFEPPFFPELDTNSDYDWLPMHYVSDGTRIGVYIEDLQFPFSQKWEGFDGIVSTYEDESSCPFISDTQNILSDPDEIYYLSASYSLNATTQIQLPAANCQWNFTAFNGNWIKVAINAIQLYPDETLRLTPSDGDAIEFNDTTIIFSRQVYYFEAGVNISYTRAERNDSWGFIMMVSANPFPTELQQLPNCSGPIVMGNDLRSFVFTNSDDSGNPYPNSAACKLDFVAAQNYESRWEIQAVDYELCCDRLTFDVVGTESQRIPARFYTTYIFPTNQSVSATWQSDGNIQRQGFQTLIEAVDCRCSPTIIFINETQPKYSLKPSVNDDVTGFFCSNVACSWTINFDPTLAAVYMVNYGVAILLRNNTDDIFTVRSASNNTLYRLQGEIYAQQVFAGFFLQESTISVDFQSGQSLQAFDAGDYGWNMEIMLTEAPARSTPTTLTLNKPIFAIHVYDMDEMTAFTVTAIVGTLEMLIASPGSIGLATYYIYDSHLLQNFLGSLDSLSQLPENATQMAPLTSATGSFTVLRTFEQFPTGTSDLLVFRIREVFTDNCLTTINTFSIDTRPVDVTVEAMLNGTGDCVMTILPVFSYYATEFASMAYQGPGIVRVMPEAYGTYTLYEFDENTAPLWNGTIIYGASFFLLVPPGGRLSGRFDVILIGGYPNRTVDGDGLGVVATPNFPNPSHSPMTPDFPFSSVVDALHNDVVFTIDIILADLTTGSYLTINGSSGFLQRYDDVPIENVTLTFPSRRFTVTYFSPVAGDRGMLLRFVSTRVQSTASTEAPGSLQPFLLRYCSSTWTNIEVGPMDVINFRSSGYPNTILLDIETLKQECMQNFTATDGRRLWIAYTNAMVDNWHMEGILDQSFFPDLDTNTDYDFLPMHYISDGPTISVTVLQQPFQHSQMWQAFEAIVTSFENENACPFSNTDATFFLSNPEEIFYLSSSYSLNATNAINLPAAICRWQFVAAIGFRIKVAINAIQLFPGETLMLTTQNFSSIVYDSTTIVFDRTVSYFSDDLTVEYTRMNRADNFGFVLMISANFEDDPHRLPNCSGSIVLGDEAQGGVRTYSLANVDPTGNAYPNWAFCDLQFTAATGFEMRWEIETMDVELCCDLMLFEVLSLPGTRMVEVRTTYIFPSQQPVRARWSSDGNIPRQGFTTTIQAVDCRCSDPVVNISQANPVALLLPGFRDSPEGFFCSNLACNWTIFYDDTGASNRIGQFYGSTQLRNNSEDYFQLRTDNMVLYSERGGEQTSGGFSFYLTEPVLYVTFTSGNSLLSYDQGDYAWNMHINMADGPTRLDPILISTDSPYATFLGYSMENNAALTVTTTAGTLEMVIAGTNIISMRGFMVYDSDNLRNYLGVIDFLSRVPENATTPNSVFSTTGSITIYHTRQSGFPDQSSDLLLFRIKEVFTQNCLTLDNTFAIDERPLDIFAEAKANATGYCVLTVLPGNLAFYYVTEFVYTMYQGPGNVRVIPEGGVQYELYEFGETDAGQWNGTIIVGAIFSLLIPPGGRLTGRFDLKEEFTRPNRTVGGEGRGIIMTDQYPDPTRFPMDPLYPFTSAVDAQFDDVTFTVTIALADLKTGSYVQIMATNFTWRRDETAVVNETVTFMSRSFTVVYYSAVAGDRGMLLRWVAGRNDEASTIPAVATTSGPIEQTQSTIFVSSTSTTTTTIAATETSTTTATAASTIAAVISTPASSVPATSASTTTTMPSTVASAISSSTVPSTSATIGTTTTTTIPSVTSTTTTIVISTSTTSTDQLTTSHATPAWNVGSILLLLGISFVNLCYKAES